MSHRESNRLRNEWAVSLLDVGPKDHVLEVGCGPGLALALAAELASEGRVVGVDHSELMAKLAAKRNRASIAAGRVEVVEGTAETALSRGELFDRVFAVNVLQFWDEPAQTLRLLHGTMKPGGIIGIAFQPRNKGATDFDAERGADRNRKLIEGAGFQDLRIETLDLSPMVTCVLGRA